MRQFLIILLIAITQQAVAEEPKTPLEKYRGTTGYFAMVCDLNIEIFNVKAGSGSNTEADANQVYGCLKEAKSQTKSLLNIATGGLKTQEQKKLLKQYHLSFLNLIDGLLPQSNEPSILYGKRKNELKAKLQESWNEFELSQ